MNVSGSNIRIMEDHDQTLKVWRSTKTKDFDLVHIDAHIDLVVQRAKPVEKILAEAKNLKEVIRNLEYSLSFAYYEKDFDKQTNIGNYVYPAMAEGIVKNFFWVVPGGPREFKESKQIIKKILRNLLKESGEKAAIRKLSSKGRKDGIITTQFKGRDIIVCTLDTLPVLKQRVLLDIDTDFLVTRSLLDAENTKNISKRKPWILPQDFVNRLEEKIKHPQVITIAYSVNGSYTPIIYKHFGDEIAYRIAPKRFKERFEKNSQAAHCFDLFLSTKKREYYKKAVKLNPTYRAADNNYGPAYLSLRKLSLAEQEFSKILRVDTKNPACLQGLGEVALSRKDYLKAKHYYSSSLQTDKDPLFTQTKLLALLGLAKTEFALKNYQEAKKLLVRYKARKPLGAQSYYLFGRICEKERDFFQAVIFYKDTIRLGHRGIEPITRLVRISSHLEDCDDIIKYSSLKYKEFKKRYLKIKKIELRKGKKMTGSRQVEAKMRTVEKRLQILIHPGR